MIGRRAGMEDHFVGSLKVDCPASCPGLYSVLDVAELRSLLTREAAASSLILGGVIPLEDC